MRPYKHQPKRPRPLTVLPPDLRSGHHAPNELTIHNAGLSVSARNKLFLYILDICEFVEGTPLQPPTWSTNAYEQAERLYCDPEAWIGFTPILCSAYVNDSVSQGYARISIQKRLRSIKMCARLASKSGAISAQVLRAILAVQPSDTHNTPIERSKKLRTPPRSEPMLLTDSQIIQLRTLVDANSNTPQDYRNALLICLIAHQGLQVGEIPSLRYEDLSLDTAQLRIDRRVGRADQVVLLEPTTIDILLQYLSYLANTNGYLVQGCRRNHQLSGQPIGDRAIFDQIRAMGAKIGIPDLAPSDCHHYWVRKHQH